MYCSTCGKEIIEESIYCKYCGAKIKKNNNKHTVDKTTYLVLAIFCGGLGIHKFYAEQTTVGIFYLLFSWTFIPAILALIDFFIVCNKQADEKGMIDI